MAFRMVRLTDSTGRECWVNPLQVQGVTEDGRGQAIIEFASGDLWVIREDAQKVATLLEHGVRDPKRVRIRKS
jgi:uncharacterized protein YlzI (FlbEa/FlbD family)